MIKAVIFDMDGVIVDSEPLHEQADNGVLNEFGKSMSKEEAIKYVGVSDEVVYSELKKKHKLPLSVEELIKKKFEIDVKLLKEKSEPMPHAIELVKQLSRSYKLAVASSSERVKIRIVLSRLKIEQYFSVLVSAEEVAESKPQPGVYLETAKRLGVNPDRCLVIEDSASGIEAAKKAGMTVIAVPNNYTKHQDLSAADKIVNNLEEIKVVDLEKI